MVDQYHVNIMPIVEAGIFSQRASVKNKFSSDTNVCLLVQDRLCSLKDRLNTESDNWVVKIFRKDQLIIDWEKLIFNTDKAS
ncbi:MAG: hypothetical protein V2I33_07250, partial [Kangiellaceae bacterium]|nr:hypothetical protein [Kangiellaceae bacterium]